MPLRSKLIIFSVVVLLLFLGLSAGSFLSLSAASRDAELAREELSKLSRVELLEQRCIAMAHDPDPGDCGQARRALDELAKKQWRGRSRERLDRLLAITRDFDSGGSPPEPGTMRAAVGDLKNAILDQVEEDLRLAEEPTHRRAVRLLIAAALAAVGCSASFAWLYARLVKERRSLEDRVRRSEKLAALGTLAAGVAHEINNPLTSISMSVEAMMDRLPGGSGLESYCQAIQEEAARCLAIVGDLSDLARGGSLDREPVDPEDLTREALRIVRRNRPPSRVEVSADVKAGLPLISADRGKLLQVLVNLVQNALEASEPAGRVEVSAERQNGRIAIRVSDDGRGIPPHLIDRIFEPFYTDKARGVGLGLTLCHRIAELHGGELIAESPGANRGSTFTLLLPLETPHGA